jgi:hypothetical protein
MLTTILAATQEEAGREVHRELPFSAEWFGIIALVIFASLFALTWAFRSVASKH